MWRNPATMKNARLFLISIILFGISCQGPKTEEQLIFESLEKLPKAVQSTNSNYELGNKHILISGNKDGSLYHEGGVYLPHLKLLSGYTAALQLGETSFCLQQAEDFSQYPFATSQFFKDDEHGIEVEKLTMLTADKAGITMLYSIKNVDNEPKDLEFIFQPFTDLSARSSSDSTNSPDQINYDELTGLFSAKDIENDWYAVWGTALAFQTKTLNSDCMAGVDSLGASAGLGVSFPLAAEEELVIPIFIAGSDKSEISAMEILADLRLEMVTDWDDNFALIDSLRKTSVIMVPDQNILQANEWSKYKTGLFQFTREVKASTETPNTGVLLAQLKELSLNYTTEIDKNLFSNLEQNKTPDQEVQPLTFQLLGIYGDVENRVTYIRPNIPNDWEEASIENLWIEDNKLSISMSSNESEISVEVTQSQKKAGISIELPEAYTKVKVLGKEVSSDTKDGYRRILMTGAHVRVEAKK